RRIGAAVCGTRMARTRRRRGIDARVRRRGKTGRAQDYLARRVGAERTGAGVLPQVELSRGRRARVSVGLGPAKGHPDGAGLISDGEVEVVCSLRVPPPNRWTRAGT